MLNYLQKKANVNTKRSRQLNAAQLRRQQFIQNDRIISQSCSISSSLSLLPSSNQMNMISAHRRQRLNRFGARLRNFLKLSKPYRWVCYEWFYSNLDKLVLFIYFVNIILNIYLLY